MILTAAQNLIIKNDILATPELNSEPQNANGAHQIAIKYNLLSATDFHVWKTDLSTKEIREDLMLWPEYVASTDLDDKQSWQYMVSNGVLDMSSVNVRAGIAEIFSKQAANPIRDSLLAGGSRLSSRIEKLLFDTSKSDGSFATPANMLFEGNISYKQIKTARES